MKEFYIQWHITNACNMRCRHCYNTHFTKEDDLGWAQLKKVCDEVIKTLNLWGAKGIINITGGEPLLKKELFNILDYLNKAEAIKDLTIITNLTLITPDTLKKLTQFRKLKNIKFSLEGLTSASCDSIRANPVRKNFSNGAGGSFQKIIQALELVKKHRKFKTILMFTVLKKNIAQVRGLLNFCREFEIDGFIVERFIPLGQSKNLKSEVLNSQEYRKIAQDLLDICQVDSDVDDLVRFRAFLVKIRNRIPYLFGAPCTIADDGCCIMPNGDVLPCRRFGASIGNILETRFSDIVEKSAILKDMKTKKNLKGKCSSCIIKSCRGCRALMFNLTGDYLAEDVQCWL